MPRWATTASCRPRPSSSPSRASHTTSTPAGRRTSWTSAATGTSRNAVPRRVVGQLLEHRADGGHGGLVAHEEQVGARAGRELDAAVGVAPPRREQRDPVTDRGARGPERAGADEVALEVEHHVDDEGRRGPGAAYVADRVGAHVAALGRRTLEPGREPGVVGALGGGDAAGLGVGEDELDALVPARTVDAEVGEVGAAELDADEGRREPLDRDHLDLGEEHGQRSSWRSRSSGLLAGVAGRGGRSGGSRPVTADRDDERACARPGRRSRGCRGRTPSARPPR